MLEADHRRFGETKQLRRIIPAVPRYDPVRPVDKNGRVKAERFNAAGDRTDLLRGVLSRIVGIRNDRSNRPLA
jgi:hypothetical protein